MSDAAEFAVLGTAFGSSVPMTIRRHPTHDAAVTHALSLDMTKWDDVWVEKASPRPVKAERPYPPPFPWNVQWVGGYAYVVDANGNKLASLLGSQKTREFVAGIVCDLQAAA